MKHFPAYLAVGELFRNFLGPYRCTGATVKDSCWSCHLREDQSTAKHALQDCVFPLHPLSLLLGACQPLLSFYVPTESMPRGANLVDGNEVHPVVEGKLLEVSVLVCCYFPIERVEVD